MFDYFFTPLNNNSCTYFLITTIIFFVMLILILAAEIFYAISNYNSITFKMFSNGIVIIFNIFIAYFVNRLLYSMCSKSLA
jgi:hypothetical protein